LLILTEIFFQPGPTNLEGKQGEMMMTMNTEVEQRDIPATLAMAQATEEAMTKKMV